MLVSTKGRYALRVMIDLAENSSFGNSSENGFIPLKDIARRQELSEKYLENILPTLIRNEFLVGHRGKGGGYKLTRAPESYTVGSVLKLVEGGLEPVSCLTGKSNTCERASECRTLPMWERLNDQLEEFFEGITIADLCETFCKTELTND
ncbi:MAG: Rrf2 family transcriptional regulator [Eggerthellaceae bacterium]|jgi:Rrf2 family protein|nr:Rrf2 family transcriptional regulator [Eggerthellaceae bacterium]